jgi:hypothetical protein
LSIVVLGDCCAMDVTALRDRIQSTLDANADIRRQAELDLKYVRARSTGGQSPRLTCGYV